MTSKETFVVNSEEDLQGYFHSVHSFIRNRFGLYGKAALQFFNFFFVLNFNNGFDEDDEDYVDCRYSKLCNIVEESLKIQRTQLIKKKIFESEHKETFFMNFPIDRFDEKKQNLSDFFNKLNVNLQLEVQEYVERIQSINTHNGQVM